MNPSELPIRDLHLPEPIGWWPLAPGWWVLIVLAGIGLSWLLYRGIKAWIFSTARRHALGRLDAYCEDYAQHGNAVTLGTQVSKLVRRTMLAYAPRGDVAGLTGDDWLEWLDRDLDRSHFVAGDGRPLIEWPYRAPDTRVDRSDVLAFIDAVRLRLRTPVGGRA